MINSFRINPTWKEVVEAKSFVRASARVVLKSIIYVAWMITLLFSRKAKMKKVLWILVAMISFFVAGAYAYLWYLPYSIGEALARNFLNFFS